MRELFLKMTMEGLAEKISCSLLIIHGSADPIFSVTVCSASTMNPDHLTKPSRSTPEGGTAQPVSRDRVCLTTMVDWMEERLK